jgi:hypothetical protein
MSIVIDGCGRPPPTRRSRYPRRVALRVPRALASPVPRPLHMQRLSLALPLSPPRLEIPQHSPTRWTKLATTRDLLVRHTTEIGCSGVHRITPPLLNGVQSDHPVLRILQSKEDEDNANVITNI